MLSEIGSIFHEQMAEKSATRPDLMPGAGWERVTRAISYVADLPVEHLKSVRLHCDTFLGTQTGSYLFMDLNTTPDEFDNNHGYSWLGDGIPSQLWADEPIIPALGRAIGISLNGKTVNPVTCDIQRYLMNMLRLGIRDGNNIVEIGAGYGGLAHAVLKSFNVRYTIVDLPETLAFSAAFLSHNLPERNIYIYKPGDNRIPIDAAIVLLPDYKSHMLDGLPIDMAINTVSFPEMERTVLFDYISLIRRNLVGCLMSVNYRGSHADGLAVTDFLKEHFTLSPTPDAIMSGLKITDDEYAHICFRPTIICTAPGVEPPRVTLRDVIMSRRVLTDLSTGTVSQL